MFSRFHVFTFNNLIFMKEVSINKNMHLSEHFPLAEAPKTTVNTADANIPTPVHTDNLKNH